MPSSSDRSVSRPLWRSFRVAFGAVLVGLVLFFGLTRTEVGRDAIRSQVEAAFNQRFEGRLSIGSLSGTLIDDVLATDVQLRAPSGALVATLDSVRGTPRWPNLLTAELSLRTLTIFRPQLSLHRDSSQTWNIERALRPKSTSSNPESPLDLTFADVEVKHGRMTTTRQGSPPQSVQAGWVFDYTRTRVTELTFTASAERTGTNWGVEIADASFALPDASLRTSQLNGELQRTETGWALRNLAVSLGGTYLRGSGTLRSSSNDSENAYSLELSRSRIDHDELRRLIPRLPLTDVVTIQGAVKGTPDHLQADGITITHDSSFATVEGKIATKSSGLTLDVQLRESQLSPGDIREVWPGMPTRVPTKIGATNVTGTINGTMAFSTAPHETFDLEARLTARSAHGAVRGSLSVARSRGSALTYSTSLAADSLNLAPITGRSALSSRLNGQVEIQGLGTTINSMKSAVDLSLSPSRLAGRPLTSADGQLRLERGSTQGRITLRQAGGGRLFLKGSGQDLGTQPNYNIVATSSELNLASLGKELPSTALNAQLTLGASGTEWRQLTGTAVLNVDSSGVRRGDSTLAIPPHSATLRLAERSAEQPRIQLSGSVATLKADGSTVGPPLWSTVRAWGLALREAARRTRNKPLPSHNFPSTTPLSSLSTGGLFPEPPSQPALPEVQSSSPINAQATVRVHQPEIVNAWWPAFPKHAEQLHAKASLRASADTFQFAGQMSAAHLQSGLNEAEDLEIEYSLAGRPDDPLVPSMGMRAEVSARRMSVGGPLLENASASLSYGSRSGTLEVQVDTVGTVADSLRMVSDLHVTPTSNELEVRQVSMNVNGSTWTNASPASVFGFADRLIVTPLVLEEPHPQTPSLQRVRVGGILSANRTDTLSVQVSNLYLPPLSEVTGLPHLLGGNLTGHLHLRGGWGRPTLVSDFSVRRLSYDRRYLGNAHLRAEYSAESPDLLLTGSLGAEVSSTDQLAGPDLVPEGIRRVDPNTISASGRVRLPQWARLAASEQASEVPAGETLDLSVNIDRADLFFFRYIFEEQLSRIEGYMNGPLHIGGRVRDPVFDANFTIEDGAVTLPLFGLEYEVEGPVNVDREGIHPRQIRVQDTEGSATVNGSILFNDYEYFSFDLSATLEGLTVIDVPQSRDLPFYGYIRGSGPLTLTGPLPDANLRSNSARTTPDSELYIPVSRQSVEEDTGFIVFADSTGRTPSLQRLTRRPNILADRPEGVPSFVEGLNLDLNVSAPNESTVHLVFDPLVGDVVTVVGSGRVQLQRQEGDFSVYGNFNASSGTYLFTAGEVFVRRFDISGGTIYWDGSPTNARLDLDAEYKTRASPSGLPGYENYRGRIPVTVELNITGRVATPRVDLSLSLTRSDQRNLVGSESLDAILNQPARTTEYATSVLLTNTFLLTTESITRGGASGTGDGDNQLTTAGNQLAFNSVSQLVSSQLNRYLGEALPNVDLNLGVQGEDPNNLDLIYGVALRLLNERLVIRGEGLYTGDDPEAQRAEGPQGEFVIEVRLSSQVSANVFYRRTGDELTRNRALTSSRGAGVSYQTQFSTWRRLFNRLFGWLLPTSTNDEEPPSEPVAQSPSAPADSTSTPQDLR